MPSFYEGGPRVTLEAMACETVAISTPVGIMKELLVDGVNAIQTGFDSESIADKMRLILEMSPAELVEIAKKGAQSVQLFERHTLIKHYAMSYLSLISKK
jgi:glycosyltransferase involved in cell wall biosynthesis